MDAAAKIQVEIIHGGCWYETVKKMSWNLLPGCRLERFMEAAGMKQAKDVTDAAARIKF